ncbi:Lateral organ boundaries LOB domain-containing protein [Dioscorea alata]|uniref:Lateral organ boundaries LOB domain-containing protein n=1 Tax=Dioscorea alata TaxID=55571 RepID=A0ACB7UK92_DIOAL|nr:Lateral organ boundaries LOB domain-containing protein [Dioscorea alata]
MSCNGCRILRKGCSEGCVLRTCLQWIDGAEAQGHATVFVAKFFGRAGLMSFISAVPESQRPALFQSLLYEACGRAVNPVGGAVGLLWGGNWHLCEAAVEAVLCGAAPRPAPGIEAAGDLYGRSSYSTAKRRKRFEDPQSGAAACDLDLYLTPSSDGGRRRRPGSPSMNSEESVTTTACGGIEVDRRAPRLLNLFV